ncbi:MAG TPA: LD-carboxypeptidase [Oculatellaceae cyanobacterium]
MGQTIPFFPAVVKPQALQAGDTIAVVSPAAPTPLEPDADGKDAFDRGITILEAEGFRVRLMPNAKKQKGYLAGSDAERLADLHEAFADPGVKAILCARGGYGCMRLLPSLDFGLISRNPKILIGFSDVTALLNPLHQQCGLVGFYGPMLTSNLVHGEPYSQTELFRLLRGQFEPEKRIVNRDAYHVIRDGVAEAPLVGGNLSLIAALCGTPYQLQTRGRILFIEDWKEKYYSLDRQFQQLKMAGLLDDLAGLLLCDFSEIEQEPDLDLPEFLKSLIQELLPPGVPAGYGFSVGHGEQTATLPIGCRARLDASEGSLTLLESPVLTS